VSAPGEPAQVIVSSGWELLSNATGKVLGRAFLTERGMNVEREPGKTIAYLEVPNFDAARDALDARERTTWRPVAWRVLDANGGALLGRVAIVANGLWRLDVGGGKGRALSVVGTREAAIAEVVRLAQSGKG